MRKGSRVLVTGAAGFIGSHLVERLVERGLEVTGIDNLSTGLVENLFSVHANRRFSFVKGDVLDSAVLSRALRGVDVVFHMAAQSSVPDSTEDPVRDFEINVQGTLNVLEYARKAKVEEVIFASSSTVYGEARALPTPEEHQFLPISNYGASKAAAEVYCTSYSSLYGLKTASLRYYNIFGPRSRKGVMFDLLRKLQKNNKKLEVLGTGGQAKDYLYIDDAVSATLLAASKGKLAGEAYTVGSDESYTVKALVAKLLKILGLAGKTKPFYTGFSWHGDVQKTRADISRLKKLGFRPAVGIDQGLKKFTDWYTPEYGEIVKM